MTKSGAAEPPLLEEGELAGILTRGNALLAALAWRGPAALPAEAAR